MSRLLGLFLLGVVCIAFPPVFFVLLALVAIALLSD